MNRKLAMGVMLSAIVFIFGACGMMGTDKNSATATDDPGNSMVENMVTEAAEMGQDVKEMITGDEEDIGIDKAKEIALKDAGKSEDDVTIVSTDQKRDGGKLLHVIEFRDDEEEFHYEIDAADGSIRAGKNDKH